MKEGHFMKTILAVAAAMLLVTTGTVLAGKTRIQFNAVAPASCSPIIDFTASEGSVLAREEKGDGCSPDFYFGLGGVGKEKKVGTVALVAAVNTNVPNTAFAIIVQYPFVSGGQFGVAATQDGKSGVPVASGTYTVLP